MRKTSHQSDTTQDDQNSVLTTNQGLPITDDQGSLKAGPRGPALLEDFHLQEKLQHLDHERIPERVVYARGAGAHGYFQVHKPLGHICKAGFLQSPQQKTPVFVRFSTMIGSRGSPDLVRDVRGFAVKFYTEDGIFDLVGQNMPVFFIQDAMKFPDLVHAMKPEPHCEIPQASTAHDTFWDFISLMPESMHMIQWLMSDRALPRSYRMMEGFGVHTFRMINDKGQATFAKFHWKPLQGLHSVLWDEAVKINGMDPDFHRRDLFDAIAKEHYPEWELGLQLFSEEDAEGFDFDILDATKLIPEELVPITWVGRLVLDRNPDNFFAETEQVAFHPGHLVPGIDFSPDPLLAGRLFAYSDTQVNRFGSPNSSELPINRPVNPVHNNQRDAAMRYTINSGRVAYQPNALGGGCPFQARANEGGFQSFPEPVADVKSRMRAPKFFDHFSQARQFYVSQTSVEKNHIAQAFQYELGKVETLSIRARMLGLLLRIDEGLAKTVGEGLGMDPIPLYDADVNHAVPTVAQFDQYMSLPTRWDLPESPTLSMLRQPNPGIATLKVAVLVGNGFDGAAYSALASALAEHKAEARIVGTHLGIMVNNKGEEINADYNFATASSVLFDAVFVPGGEDSIRVLQDEPRALHFIAEAWRHCKAVGLAGEARALLEGAGLLRILGNSLPPEALESGETVARDGLLLGSHGLQLSKRFIEALQVYRFWSRERRPQPPV
ncbi:catalase [Oligoflexus tunisiensis]|uniref:catalase n=1 Tax=Oligoflexus tunisiensis TaxID=708132 RepID=UPI000A5A9DE0|nr:catalase [Oligoflexus tunisiensis]